MHLHVHVIPRYSGVYIRCMRTDSIVQLVTAMAFASVACGTAEPGRNPSPGATAAGLQANAPWPMYRRGIDHSGRSSSRGPSSPHLRWARNPGNPSSSGLSSYCPPVIAADGTLYVAGSSGSVVALSAEGTIKWQVHTGGRCDGSPAITEGGTVVVAMRDLHAIGPDGVELWRSPAPVDGLGGSPAIATDGTIYVSGEDSGLYAMNADGSAKWHVAAAGRGKSSPAVANDGTVYIGADSKIAALTPGGAKKWEASVEDSEHLSPTIDREGNVAAIVRDMLIFAPDGTTLVTVAAEAKSPQFPAAFAPDGTWVLGTASGLAKYNPPGVASWKVTAPAGFSAPVIDVDGNVYVSDAFCHVRSYDPAGQQRWSLEPAPGASCGGPVMAADGTLYLTSESAGILAVGD